MDRRNNTNINSGAQKLKRQLSERNALRNAQMQAGRAARPASTIRVVEESDSESDYENSNSTHVARASSSSQHDQASSSTVGSSQQERAYLSVGSQLAHSPFAPRDARPLPTPTHQPARHAPSRASSELPAAYAERVVANTHSARTASSTSTAPGPRNSGSNAHYPLPPFNFTPETIAYLRSQDVFAPLPRIGTEVEGGPVIQGPAPSPPAAREPTLTLRYAVQAPSSNDLTADTVEAEQQPEYLSPSGDFGRRYPPRRSSRRYSAFENPRPVPPTPPRGVSLAQDQILDDGEEHELQEGAGMQGEVEEREQDCPFWRMVWSYTCKVGRTIACRRAV
ncbi:hypothetical protein NA57DRAFT_61812 [Rhizodiscina lignyota]|uniref:Uncharacterized protein n=1 Tax=Rhizodiscina lignyota TaxID=1504668 RepID=A0A9P4I7R4_9PEZI|nr:hypothetical protein NA57DRAFT_61812 [Rhizodiscina lignyota]